jgi:putative N-acetyltransferase (TIGR04045 family)
MHGGGDGHGRSERTRARRAQELVEVRWWRSPEELEGAFAVRARVFVGEQGVSAEEELDALDDEARHVVALAPDGTDTRVVGTLRLLVNGERAKIGRVAVERQWRRQGIALRMLELAIAQARADGCSRVRLAAQTAATEVYARAGFTVESEEFVEAGIPHVWMSLALAA